MCTCIFDSCKIVVINFSLFLCAAITIEPEIQNITEDPIVGHPYEIQCIVEEVSIDFGNIKWIGPNGDAILNDSRRNITYITVENNHLSILQFAYLKETDNGSYNCSVEKPYNITYDDSIMLEDFMSKLTFYYLIINQLLCSVATWLYSWF